MTSARRGIALAGALVVVVAGCSRGAVESTASREGVARSCVGSSPGTVRTDELTIATYDPVFAPWFVGNDPGKGQGFEAALGFRIGQQLGFEPRKVRWVRVPFERILHPHESDFDLALGEVSITPERKEGVDFSTPYASTQQAVVAHVDSPAAKTTKVKDLRDTTFGASVQTTSLAAVRSVIHPKKVARSYPTIAAAASALGHRRVDGVVVDYPTAEYLATATLENGTLVGRLPKTKENIGAVLSKGSGLTKCVNAAIGQLRKDGTISDLEDEWLPRRGGIPTLK